MRSVTASLHKSGEKCLKLSHSIVDILSAAIMWNAGIGHTTLYAFRARSLTVTFVLATVAFRAAVPDSLAPLSLSKEFECFCFDALEIV